jgi:hypothetical protein
VKPWHLTAVVITVALLGFVVWCVIAFLQGRRGGPSDH